MSLECDGLRELDTVQPLASRLFATWTPDNFHLVLKKKNVNLTFFLPNVT